MNRTEKLEQALCAVLADLQEDIPVENWSRHLRDSVRDAYDLLVEEKTDGTTRDKTQA